MITRELIIMNRSKIYDLTMISICLAIMIIGAKISIPIGPIPVTLQTLAVFLISLILGTKKSIILFVTYIILGLIGLPVFSTGGGIQLYIQMMAYKYIEFLHQLKIQEDLLILK